MKPSLSSAALAVFLLRGDTNAQHHHKLGGFYIFVIMSHIIKGEFYI